MTNLEKVYHSLQNKINEPYKDYPLDFKKRKCFQNILNAQFLLYLIQGYSLAVYDKEVFSEDILYLKDRILILELEANFIYNIKTLKQDYCFENIIIDEYQEEAINFVVKIYGGVYAHDLNEIINSHDPVIFDKYEATNIEQVIKKENIKSYFKQNFEKIFNNKENKKWILNNHHQKILKKLLIPKHFPE